MQGTGIGVDTVAYNAVFSALRVNNDADTAYKLWRKMGTVEDSASRFRHNASGSRPDIITVTECISILSNAGRLAAMDEVFAEAVRWGIVLSNDSLDDEFEVDLSGMSLPVARAACRFVMRRLLSSDNTVTVGQEMNFITGVGKSHHHQNDHPGLNASTEFESLFDKNPETSLQSYCCGILQTDFDPPLDHSIPERAPGTVAVKLPTPGLRVAVLT
jgi:hypothetical protein